MTRAQCTYIYTHYYSMTRLPAVTQCAELRGMAGFQLELMSSMSTRRREGKEKRRLDQFYSPFVIPTSSMDTQRPCKQTRSALFNWAISLICIQESKLYSSFSRSLPLPYKNWSEYESALLKRDASCLNCVTSATHTADLGSVDWKHTFKPFHKGRITCEAHTIWEREKKEQSRSLCRWILIKYWWSAVLKAWLGPEWAKNEQCRSSINALTSTTTIYLWY